MATAAELFKEGQLSAAIDAQIAEVKSHPADAARRLFLFELAAFAGDLDRAERQIDAIKYEELELQAAVTNYRRLIDAERKRREVFACARQPKFLTDPPEHVGLRLEALAALHAGDRAAANEKLAAAYEITPALAGELTVQDREQPIAFEGIRDGDDLFGTVLEVMSQGEYFWVPLEQLESLAAVEPQFPRDLLWIPARIDTPTQSGEVFLPVLYPNSHLSEDGEVKLGRATDWLGDEDTPVQGIGGRLFLVGEDFIPLLDWRELQLEVPEEREA